MMSGSSGCRPPGEASGEDSSLAGEEAGATKKKSKIKLGPFKSLREASRTGSFRLGGRKKSVDESSLGSNAGEGTNDRESKKGGSKKKRAEEEEGKRAPSASVEDKGGGSEGAGVGVEASPAKKKKKKGSSLVRKLSSKYRSKSSSMDVSKRMEEKEASLVLSEAAAVCLPEEEEDILSMDSSASTTTGSAGVGTPMRTSENKPPPISSPSLSGPTLSSSTSSSISVNAPPATKPSPEIHSPPIIPKGGGASPLAEYVSSPSPTFPTTFPLYYKPPLVPSIVGTTRRSVTPPYQHPSSPLGSRGIGDTSPPGRSSIPRGPLGASLKAKEPEGLALASAILSSSPKESCRMSASGKRGGEISTGSTLVSIAKGSAREGERNSEKGGESIDIEKANGVRSTVSQKVVEGVVGAAASGGEEAPPTSSTPEKRESEEKASSLLRSESEATVEKSSKVEVATQEGEKERREGEEERVEVKRDVKKEEGETAKVREKVEGVGGEKGEEEVAEVADSVVTVRGPIEVATVEEPRAESLEEEGAIGGEREASPPQTTQDMEEGPETATALASGGGGASGGAMIPGGIGAGKREHLYKILVIGELGTGKTSIIKRYVHQFFSQHYRATIGVDFALKVINWDADTIIRLQLWDIAGQERFGNMTRVYYKEAVGAFIVFDVTRSATFESVVKWKVDLDSKVQLPDGSPIPCVLLANKCDQQKEGIVNNPTKMEEYCKEKGFAGWFETSAKENINIEEAARFLVTKILKNDRLTGVDTSKDSERFALDGSGPGMNGSGGRGGSGRQEGKSCAC